jgi:hypothetical protein
MSCNGCGGGHYRCLKCGFVGCDGDDCPSYFFESGFFSKEGCCACGSEEYEATRRTIPPKVILLVLLAIYLFLDYNLDWAIFTSLVNVLLSTNFR